MDKSISKFFMDDYCQYASYDVYRRIPSLIDGLKVSSRKVLYTVLKNKIKEPIKVSQLASKISEQTEYLHGEGSLNGVIVGLAQDFPGTNNIVLLQRDGAFGSRLEPTAAAPRYIKTAMLPIMEKIFRAEDNAILINQVFEGTTIEPKFFIPTLPLALINGSNGMAVGFAHNILPRNPKDIIKYIKDKLQNKESKYNFIPYYQGFYGAIKQTDINTYTIEGKLEVINTTKIVISELPVNVTLESYLKHLIKLEDSGIIKSYQDKSNKGKFEFIVDVTREFTSTNTIDEMKKIFKIIKNESENFTLLDENLLIKQFSEPKDLIDEYIKIKLKFVQARKDFIINELIESISLLKSKIVFIRSVIDGSLKLTKRPITDIENDLDNIKEIFKIDNKYDYLLNMPIASITKEKYEKLLNQLKNEQENLKQIKTKTIQSMWIDDIEELEKIL